MQTYEVTSLQEAAQANAAASSGDTIKIIASHEGKNIKSKDGIAQLVKWARAVKAQGRELGKDIAVQIGEWTLEQAEQYAGKRRTQKQ